MQKLIPILTLYVASRGSICARCYDLLPHAHRVPHGLDSKRKLLAAFVIFENSETRGRGMT